MKMSKLLILSSIFLRLISLTTSEYDFLSPKLSPASQLDYDFVSPPFLDCSAVRYEMVDCVSYLTDDSKRTTPEASCCSGFETVLSTDFNCMCEVIKTIAAAGIDFNAERAMALPSACNVSVPPLASCRISAAPEFAPANSPNQWPWSDASPPISPNSPPNSQPMGSRKSATSEPPRSFKTPAPKSSNPPNAVPESSETSAPKPSRSGATTYSKTSSFIVLIFMMLFA